MSACVCGEQPWTPTTVAAVVKRRLQDRECYEPTPPLHLNDLLRASLRDDYLSVGALDPDEILGVRVCKRA